MMELDPFGLGEVGGRDLYKRAQESSRTCCRSAEREAVIFFLFFKKKIFLPLLVF